MKKIILTLTLIVTGFAMDSIVQAYEVLNGNNWGFKVTAGNYVYVSTPDGKKIQITDGPFIGDGYSLPPIGPIICSWAPSRKWVAIFVTADKETGIFVFDLQKESLLEAKRTWSQYPSWFAKPQLSGRDKPVEWEGNKLLIDSSVKFKDGSTRRFSQEAVVEGGVYNIKPTNTEGSSEKP